MHEFKSEFAAMIRGFISLKQSLGYSYKSEILLLSDFDAACASDPARPCVLTKELAGRWIAARSESERPGTTNHRISVMREFARYLSLTGVECWVPPPGLRARGGAFACRMITPEEAASIFAEADKFEDPSRKWLGLSASAILRLLYSTGMRPGEAVGLRMGDVDLGSGTARIIESKGHKDRVIALGSDIAGLLGNYSRALESCPGRSFFFYDGGGDPRSRIEPRRIGSVLRRLCHSAGIKPPMPRANDFRHAFITIRILEWHRQGADLRARLPFLSAYAGHSSIQDTMYYFRLAPGLLPALPAGSAAEGRDHGQGIG